MLIPRHPPEHVRGRVGRIVNVASINALGAHPNKPAYVAAKHGLLVIVDLPTFL